jgi:hypothetical protein
MNRATFQEMKYMATNALKAVQNHPGVKAVAKEVSVFEANAKTEMEAALCIFLAVIVLCTL